MDERAAYLLPEEQAKHTQEQYARTHPPGGDLPEPAAHRFPQHTRHWGAFLTTAEQIVRFVPGLIRVCLLFCHPRRDVWPWRSEMHNLQKTLCSMKPNILPTIWQQTDKITIMWHVSGCSWVGKRKNCMLYFLDYTLFGPLICCANLTFCLYTSLYLIFRLRFGI